MNSVNDNDENHEVIQGPHAINKKQVIEMVYELPFDVLIDLRNLVWKELPTPEIVLEFLEKKSKEKKGA